MALHHPLPDVIAYFQLARGPGYAPRYNLAPSQAIPVIRQKGEERVLTLLRLGLVPPWANVKFPNFPSGFMIQPTNQ